MPSTASQLERSLRRLQISGSQETSTQEQWVPSKYNSDVTQYALVRPPRAPCGNRQLFARQTLPDDCTFLAMNSLTFIKVSLGLRISTMAQGKVVGDSKHIPSECMSLGEVLLLVLWRDTEPEATCPTQSQVHYLAHKLKRSPGWWVEVPPF
ncbi:hypothetical protein EDB19DRAFT_1724371 [Suillus lakei]|nr:hypothetical protein EDB19DRAFT_1724371 [Suillus lakei]